LAYPLLSCWWRIVVEIAEIFVDSVVCVEEVFTGANIDNDVAGKR